MVSYDVITLWLIEAFAVAAFRLQSDRLPNFRDRDRTGERGKGIKIMPHVRNPLQALEAFDGFPLPRPFKLDAYLPAAEAKARPASAVITLVAAGMGIAAGGDYSARLHVSGDLQNDGAAYDPSPPIAVRAGTTGIIVKSPHAGKEREGSNGGIEAAPRRDTLYRLRPEMRRPPSKVGVSNSPGGRSLHAAARQSTLDGFSSAGPNNHAAPSRSAPLRIGSDAYAQSELTEPALQGAQSAEAFFGNQPALPDIVLALPLSSPVTQPEVGKALLQPPSAAVLEASTDTVISPSLGREVSAPKQTTRGVEFTVDATINGVAAGRLPLLLMGSVIGDTDRVAQEFSIRLADIVNLLSSRMSSELLNWIRSSRQFEEYVTFNDLRSHGMTVAFD